VLSTPPPDHEPAMAAKGETGAASAAPAEMHSDADNKAARAMMEPDILMTSVSVR
jgi:hypothetical protein